MRVKFWAEKKRSSQDPDLVTEDWLDCWRNTRDCAASARGLLFLLLLRLFRDPLRLQGLRSWLTRFQRAATFFEETRESRADYSAFSFSRDFEPSMRNGFASSPKELRPCC